MIGRNLWHIARGKPKRQNPCFGITGPQGRFELVAANRVIDNISATQGFHNLADIVGFRVNQMISPCLFADGQLFSAACTRDDFGAHQFTQLDRGKPNAARCTKNQKPFASFQMCFVIQRDVACAVCDQKRSRIYGIHVIREWHADVSGYCGIIGQTTNT